MRSVDRDPSATATGTGSLTVLSAWDGTHGRSVDVYDSGPGYTPGPRITTYFTMEGSAGQPPHRNRNLSLIASSLHAGSLMFTRLTDWSWKRVHGRITWTLRLRPTRYWAAPDAPTVVTVTFDRAGRAVAATERMPSISPRPMIRERMAVYAGPPIPAHA